MDKEVFIQNCLDKLNIPDKTSNNKSIIILISKGYREAGLSAGGASKWTKKWFPNKRIGLPIFTYLLNMYNKSFCSYCQNVLPQEDFHSNKSSNTKKQHYCKKCTSYYRSNFVNTNFYNTKRRKYIKERTPNWANLDKIKEIYDNCPRGYHVDHIIPLKGEFISGLHIETNLQYLTAEENMQKGNNFKVD